MPGRVFQVGQDQPPGLLFQGAPGRIRFAERDGPLVMFYGKDRPPRWVSEGIADWVRWFNHEPEGRRPRLKNPQKAKYTTGYRTTAIFFDWIVKNKDRTFVTRLNSACRKGQYRPELFQKFTGKSVDNLWGEFISAQQQ